MYRILLYSRLPEGPEKHLNGPKTAPVGTSTFLKKQSSHRFPALHKPFGIIGGTPRPEEKSAPPTRSVGFHEPARLFLNINFRKEANHLRWIESQTHKFSKIAIRFLFLPGGEAGERIPLINSRIEPLNQRARDIGLLLLPQEEKAGMRRLQGSGGILIRRSEFDVRRSMFPRFMVRGKETFSFQTSSNAQGLTNSEPIRKFILRSSLDAVAPMIRLNRFR
jgi:hypothetical protein